MSECVVCTKQDGSSEYGGGEGREVAINIAAKVAELQQKIEEQAILHEDLLRQLENIRHGIVQDIVDKHPDDAAGKIAADEHKDDSVKKGE